MADHEELAETKEVIDLERVGKKGFPRHYQAFGLEPPKKEVPVETIEASDSPEFRGT